MPPTNNVGIEEVYVTKDSDEVSVIRKIKFTTGAPSELTNFVSGTWRWCVHSTSKHTEGWKGSLLCEVNFVFDILLIKFGVKIPIPKNFTPSPMVKT